MGIHDISLCSLAECFENFIKEDANVPVGAPKGGPAGTETTAHALTDLRRALDESAPPLTPSWPWYKVWLGTQTSAGPGGPLFLLLLLFLLFVF